MYTQLAEEEEQVYAMTMNSQEQSISFPSTNIFAFQLERNLRISLSHTRTEKNKCVDNNKPIA
jgi:hypothetical protein